MGRKRISYGRDQEYVPVHTPKPKPAPAKPPAPKRAVGTAKPEPLKPILDRNLADEGARLQAYIQGRIDGTVQPKRQSRILTPRVVFAGSVVLVLVLMVVGALAMGEAARLRHETRDEPTAAIPTAPEPSASMEPAPDADIVQVKDDALTKRGAGISGGTGDISPERAAEAREDAEVPGAGTMPSN